MEMSKNVKKGIRNLNQEPFSFRRLKPILVVKISPSASDSHVNEKNPHLCKFTFTNFKQTANSGEKKLTTYNSVHIYTTSKQIELESPNCSGFKVL